LQLGLSIPLLALTLKEHQIAWLAGWED
jgi:hypothetical protein